MQSSFLRNSIRITKKVLDFQKFKSRRLMFAPISRSADLVFRSMDRVPVRFRTHSHIFAGPRPSRPTLTRGLLG